MSAVNKELTAISRRDFLKVSGLSAGGLIIGVSLPMSVMGSAADSVFEPNAFVYIEKNGDTTIFCGRCDMKY